MISVEGYKAFHGDMRITYSSRPPEIIADTDWLYKPDTGCWYGGGRSFPFNTCEIIKESN